MKISCYPLRRLERRDKGPSVLRNAIPLRLPPRVLNDVINIALIEAEFSKLGSSHGEVTIKRKARLAMIDA